MPCAAGARVGKFPPAPGARSARSGAIWGAWGPPEVTSDAGTSAVGKLPGCGGGPGKGAEWSPDVHVGEPEMYSSPGLAEGDVSRTTLFGSQVRCFSRQPALVLRMIKSFYHLLTQASDG